MIRGGDDALLADDGADLLCGGSGNDSVSYEARTDPLMVTVDGVADDGAPARRLTRRSPAPPTPPSRTGDARAHLPARPRASGDAPRGGEARLTAWNTRVPGAS